ncbi:formate hydrogenlyase subunit 3 [Salmonella enterica subsp. arizonae]|nr:formate hydrogenlyase subunit 3 [Salmonella enterica subsp. arizonae]
MPVISIAMLVGLMAMAALPPLNGFAGEWVIYQSFFRLGNSGAFVGRLLGPLLAVGLAVTGALAVMCMAKVYGVTFLGAPRTKEAENASCAPILMGVSVVALAICCVLGGVAAPWLLPMISTAVPLPLETAHTHRISADDYAAADCLSAIAIHHYGDVQRQPSAIALPRRGLGVRLRPRAVDGDHRARFRHAGERGLCPVLKLRQWLNPVSLVPGWQSAAAAVLFRRLALIELAVLVVIVVSRGA